MSTSTSTDTTGVTGMAPAHLARPPGRQRQRGGQHRRRALALVGLVCALVFALVAPPASAATGLDLHQGVVWGEPLGSAERLVSQGGAGSPVAAIDAGGRHGLAISIDGDAVLAWGDNLHGQLGNGTVADRPIDDATVVSLPAGTRFVQVSASSGHSLALTRSGEVWAWGHNNHGQLGDGSITDRHAPVQVELPPGLPDGTRVVAVAAGGSHSLALTNDGQVLAWGNNGYGQLGDGSTIDRHEPVALPVHARAISASLHHSVALLADGTVAGWGFNGHGELGDGSHTNRSTPHAMDLPHGVIPIAVQAGGFHTLVLAADGSVYATGWNINGQLGDGSNQGQRQTPVPVLIPAGERAIAIAAGTYHSLALTDTGTVYGWGMNNSGQVAGTGREYRTPKPVDLPAEPGIVSVSAGGLQSMALTALFTDVDATNPFVADATWLSVRDITRGYTDGSYRPVRPVTRQVMAAYLYRMLHRGAVSGPCSSEPPFPDVPADSIFCGAIDWLAGLHITEGYADGMFRPARAVNRQEMAAFLARLPGAGGSDDGNCAERPYPDVPASSIFCAAIAWLAEVGIARGYPDGSYRPTAVVSRQTMAAYLHRLDNATHLYGIIIDPIIIID